LAPRWIFSGLNAPEFSTKMGISMLEKLIDDFQKLFKTKPLIAASAPGRINIIGEHTDYNDGYVLPAAVHLRTYCLLSPRPDGQVNVYSRNFQQLATFSLKGLQPSAEKSWWTYVQGIFWVLLDQQVSLSGADILIHGDVPLEAGLSSSASLEVGLLYGLLKLGKKDWPPEKIARLGQRAENEFVGVRCGLMDQFVAALAKKGSALFLNCETGGYEYIPLRLEKAGLVFLIYDTKVPRQLAGSKYNERRAEAQKAREIMKEHGLPSTKGVTGEKLNKLQGLMDQVLFRRARHVLGENNRVIEAKEALRKDDFIRLGELLFASHYSLRDDYEVSCPELDLFVEAAKNYPGCLGARLVGAGFGGSAIALVKKEAVEGLALTAAQQARKRNYPQPQTLVVSVGSGASAFWL